MRLLTMSLASRGGGVSHPLIAELEERSGVLSAVQAHTKVHTLMSMVHTTSFKPTQNG